MSNRIKELREKQATITAAARERLDQINGETDEARAAELETQHDAAMAEFDRIEKLIEREEKMADIERRMEDREREQRDRRRYRPSDRSEDESREADDGKPTYRSAFLNMIRAGGDLSALEPEERSLLRAGFVKDEKRAQTTSNSAGGYTVPTELANFIDIAMKATGPMYDPGVTSEMVTSGGNPVPVPTIDDTASVAVAHTEGAALTDDGGSDVTFGQKLLNAYAFDTEWVKWSFELAADSAFNIEEVIGRLLGERLGRMANLQLTTGTGSSAPNGIVTASSAGVTAAGTAAITYDEIIDLEHSVDPAYRSGPRVRYMMNDSTLKAIRKLKDGDGNYLWQMGNVQAGIPSTINGRTYSINQAMDSLAAGKKVMLFGDFGSYWVRKVGSPVLGVVRERFWPDLGMAGVIRFDGELMNTAAVKHLITAAS